MSEKIEKKRLDVLVYELGYTQSREKARAVIMAGLVYVDNQKADKPGSVYPVNVKLEVRGGSPKYVSRGGFKLEKAMKAFDIDLKDSDNVNAKIYKVIGRNIRNVYGKIETIGSATYVVPIDKTLKNLKISVEGDYLE